MRTKDSIIVLGLLGQFPLAGIAWQLLHHLVGFQRLGFDAYYIEDTKTAPYDPQARTVVEDCAGSVRYVADAMKRIGMDEAWAYQDVLSGQWYGLPKNQVRDLCDHALCAVNLCGASNPATLTFRPKGPLLYLETDPVINQVRLAQGDSSTFQFLAAHDAHVTYGVNLGAPDCPIPLSDFKWKKTRPPVVLDLWPFQPDPICQRFTTITTWQNRGKDLVFKEKQYHWSKHLNFLTLLDLPQRSAQALELATYIDDELTRMQLQRHGWTLIDVRAVSRGPSVYQNYICSSRGEFTVSKEVVAGTRSGWFSDRSVCYLAAGKPVVTQETGFSKYVPTGNGLFGFSSAEEAIAALNAINSNYLAHARSAREIASEYFAAEKLLEKLLSDVGIG